jgi:hypothetical protein
MPELKEWGTGARRFSKALVYVYIGCSLVGLAVLIAILVAAFQAFG